MKLILFALLAFFTFTLLRLLRSPRRGRKRRGGAEESRKPPAISPDEIVDVKYEDCESSSKQDDREAGP